MEALHIWSNQRNSLVNYSIPIDNIREWEGSVNISCLVLTYDMVSLVFASLFEEAVKRLLRSQQLATAIEINQIEEKRPRRSSACSLPNRRR